jgi:FAD:protein FMN transferase
MSTADAALDAKLGARFAPGNRIEHLMGTVISLDLRAPGVSPAAIDAAFEHLRDIDARFSTYRPDSEICRLGRGELSPKACSPDVRKVLERCESFRVLSHGYFDIRAHRTDGALDPSGFVKGWAVEAAAAILDAAEARNYCLNAGGDVIARGESSAGRPWRIGIRHPERVDRLATVLEVRDLAVATSGAYERGSHITDPHTKAAPDGVLSVTVVGASLAAADAYATAAYAMGSEGLAWIATLPGYAGCAITADRRLVWTEGFGRYKARA